MSKFVWSYVFFVVAPSLGMLVAGYVCSTLAWPRARQVGRTMGWLGIAIISTIAALMVLSVPRGKMLAAIPFTVLLAASPVISCGLAIICNKEIRKPEHPACAECGYNLTGLVEARCPECGKPFDPGELNRSSG